MKNKLAKIVTVLTVIGLMAAGPVVYATLEGDNPERGEDSPQGPGKGPMNELGLTPSQSAALTAQANPAQQEKNKAMMEQLRRKNQELDLVINESGTTLSDASDLVEEISEIQEKILFQRVERLFSMKKILTPEQFEKWQGMNKPGADQKPAQE